MAQKVTKNNTEATTSKLVNELLSQVDSSEILSKDGLFSKLKKQLIERVLQSELEHELGYDKHSKKGTIIDNEGNKMPIEVPRDREGEYDPQFVPKV